MKKLSLTLALLLVSSLGLSHWYSIRQIDSPPTEQRTTTYRCIDSTGITVANSPTFAASEAECGRLATERGGVFFIEEHDSIARVTRTHEIRGSTNLKITAAEASLIVVGGGNGGGGAAPSEDGLYDLSAFDLPAFVDDFNWPTPPSASTVINIPANDSTALNNALVQNDVHIIVPAGSYTWNADITGSDLWLDMDNGATLTHSVQDYRNITGARTKITGGNMVLNQAFNRGTFVISGHSGDLLIENVNMNVNSITGATTGGGPSRVAFLNNTITTRDGIIYFDTVPTPGGFSNQDVIFAGNNFIKNEYGQAQGRMYDQNRLIVVDNRLTNLGNSYWRILGGSLDCFYGYNQMEQGGSESSYVSTNHFNTLDSNSDLKIPDRIYINNNTWYNINSGANIFASLANGVTIQGNRAYQPGAFEISANGETPPSPANYSDNLRVGPYETPPTWTKGADH